jgi:hypothetical protein
VILIKFYAVDVYQLGTILKHLHFKIAKLLKVAPESLHIVSSDSLVFYNGVDQYNYRGYLEVLSDHQLSNKEALMTLLKEHMQPLGLHFTISFLETATIFEFGNDEYPKSVSDENTVMVEENQDETEDETREVYLGNVFKDVGK